MNKNIVFVLLCILVLAFATGCQKADTTKTATTQQTATAAQQTQQTDDAKAELKSLLSSKNSAEFKVEYNLALDTEMQTQTGGSVKQSMKGTEVIAQKGKNTKIDVAQTIAGQFVTSTVYILDGKMYTCAKLADKYNCFEGKETQESAQKSPEDIESSIDSYRIKASGQTTIAGETAKCYTIFAGQAAYDDLVMTECITSEGIPVSIKVTTGDGRYTYSLEAKSVVKKVEDKEFELPVKPVSI